MGVGDWESAVPISNPHFQFPISNSPSPTPYNSLRHPEGKPCAESHSLWWSHRWSGWRWSPRGRASLYSPEAPFAVPFEEGKPSQLPFDEFKRRRGADERDDRAGSRRAVEPDRQAFLDRIEQRTPKGTKAERDRALRKMLPGEVAALATDLFRVGKIDLALNYLTERRGGSYFVSSELAHVHAARGEWADALRYHTEGRLDADMPEEVKGLSKPQRDWWEKLDATYVTHFYHFRAADADARAKLTAKGREQLDESEEVLPLFTVPQEGSKSIPPVRFVNDAGAYEPGVLAASEKAKLPPDAIAVVQQLIMWFPGETRLYWLLAELYAAEGDLDAAIAIFDECAWGLRYGNRKLLMEHRAAVRAAIDAKPKPAPIAAPASPISMRDILLYFGVVGVVVAIALGRVLYKRMRADESVSPRWAINFAQATRLSTDARMSTPFYKTARRHLAQLSRHEAADRRRRPLHADAQPADPFTLLVRCVISQQISTKAAASIYGRLAGWSAGRRCRWRRSRGSPTRGSRRAGFLARRCGRSARWSNT